MASMRTLGRLEDGDAADGTWSLVIPLSARGSELNSRRWVLGRLLQATSQSPSASSQGRDRSRLARASQPPFIAILLLPSMSAVFGTFRERMNVPLGLLAFRKVSYLISDVAEIAGLGFGCAVHGQLCIDNLQTDAALSPLKRQAS